MQGTLANLRQCAAQMKTRAATSSVKDRVELSEKAMTVYRDLKCIAKVECSPKSPNETECNSNQTHEHAIRSVNDSVDQYASHTTSVESA